MTFAEIIADIKDAVNQDDRASCLSVSDTFDIELQVKSGHLGSCFKVYRTSGVSVEYNFEGYGTFTPQQAAKIHDFALFAYTILKENNQPKIEELKSGKFDPSV